MFLNWSWHLQHPSDLTQLLTDEATEDHSWKLGAMYKKPGSDTCWICGLGLAKLASLIPTGPESPLRTTGTALSRMPGTKISTAELSSIAQWLPNEWEAIFRPFSWTGPHLRDSARVSLPYTAPKNNYSYLLLCDSVFSSVKCRLKNKTKTKLGSKGYSED